MTANISLPGSQLPHDGVGAALPLPRIPSRKAQGLRNDSYEVWIYLAGSTALRLFLQPLGITAFKLGTSRRRHVGDRIVDLRRKTYAGVFGPPNDPSAPGIPLPRSHEWFQIPILPAYLNGVDFPPSMELDSNALWVTVPSKLSVVEFDEAVRAALAPRELAAYLGSADGQRRLIEVGLDPTHRLLTNYTLIGPAARRSIAREIFLIRPRCEMAALIGAIQAIITV